MSATRIDTDALIALRRAADAVDLSSRRRVMTELGGQRLSGFRGRGMEFDDFRVYQPGDDLRTMDWRVTARTGTPHVRLYQEERERPVILAVDLRAGMWFGTRGCFKAVAAARAAALCAWAAAANNDRVGGLTIADASHDEIRPGAGRRRTLQLIHAMAAHQAPTSPTKAGDSPALADALRRLNRTARSGALVGVFSDFDGLGDTESALLHRLGQRTELIIGFVHDVIEQAPPPPGRYPVTDGRDALRVLDTADRALCQRWQLAYQRRVEAVARIARQCRAHWLDLPTHVSAEQAVSQAFGRRRLAA